MHSMNVQLMWETIGWWKCFPGKQIAYGRVGLRPLWNLEKLLQCRLMILRCNSVLHQVSVYQTISQSKKNYFRFLKMKENIQKEKHIDGEWKIEKYSKTFEKEVIDFFLQEHEIRVPNPFLKIGI